MRKTSTIQSTFNKKPSKGNLFIFEKLIVFLFKRKQYKTGRKHPRFEIDDF